MKATTTDRYYVSEQAPEERRFGGSSISAAGFLKSGNSHCATLEEARSFVKHLEKKHNPKSEYPLKGKLYIYREITTVISEEIESN